MGRIRDQFLNQEPTFETRLIYSMYTNKYDDNAEEAWGYLDSAKICLEGNKSIEELQTLLEASTGSDSYDKGYRQAIKDFIKQVNFLEVEENHTGIKSHRFEYAWQDLIDTIGIEDKYKYLPQAQYYNLEDKPFNYSVKPPLPDTIVEGQNGKIYVGVTSYSVAIRWGTNGNKYLSTSNAL